MPTPNEAFAPIDVMGPYSKVAESVERAGSGLQKSMADFSAFERAQDKERMRQKAIAEILQKKPHMAAVINPQTTTLEDLGKGLAQLGAGTVLWQQAKAARLPMPSPEQFEPAVFGASPEAFKQLQAAWEKQIEEAQKQGFKAKEGAAKSAASGTAFQKAGEVKAELTKTLGRAPTQEELLAEYSRRGVSPEDLGPQGVPLVEKMAQSQTDIDKANSRHEAALLAGKRLAQQIAKDKGDQRLQQVKTAFMVAVENGNAQLARDKLAAMADVYRAKGEEQEMTAKGTGTYYQNAAAEIDRLRNNTQANFDELQALASGMGELLMDVVPSMPSGKGAPAPAPVVKKKQPIGF